MQVLNHIFPVPLNASVSDDCMFKMSMFESILCQRCNFTSDTTVSNINCPVAFEDPYHLYTTRNLIESLIQDPHGNFLYDFSCSNCRIIGSCTKATSLVHISDFVILHLKFFKYRNGRIEKMIPNLQIDEKITTALGTLTLHAIV